jgi:hypothetical protein
MGLLLVANAKYRRARALSSSQTRLRYLGFGRIVDTL